MVVPVQFVTDAGTLSFFSTTTVFGTPVDITLSELALEAFFPADAATAEALRRWCHQPSAPLALSAAISSGVSPASRRISSECAPSAGPGPGGGSGTSASENGTASVRGISGCAVGTMAPAATACSSSTRSSALADGGERYGLRP